MATTARLGLDIVARDKTRAGFASVQRSMDAMNRSVRTIKAGLAGFAGGNLFASFTRSIVDINKSVPAVSLSIDQLHASWRGFALEVGNAGLNKAIIDFNERMSAMLAGTNGLSASLGQLMGGGLRLLGATFEGVGRGLAFAYDNIGLLTRGFVSFFAIAAAQRVFLIGQAFIRLVTAIRAAGLVMGLFHAVSRANTIVLLGMGAVIAKLTGTFDDLEVFMKNVWASAESLAPVLGERLTQAMQLLGFNTDALIKDFDAFEGKLNGTAAAMGSVAAAAGKIAAPAAAGMKELTRTQTLAIDIGDTFRGWGQDILKGVSAMDALKSALARFQSQMLDRAFDLLLPSASGGVGGGFNPGSILGAFGGMFADGGNLGSGKWGIAGEDGPEIVRGPASIVPMGGGGVQVNVHNYGNGTATVKESGWGDKRKLDVYVRDAMAKNTADPYSPASRVLGARGAGTPVKRR